MVVERTLNPGASFDDRRLAKDTVATSRKIKCWRPQEVIKVLKLIDGRQFLEALDMSNLSTGREE